MADLEDLNAHNEYLTRKLAHYNEWLLDKARPFGVPYAGFPEDLVARPKRKIAVEEKPVVKAKAKPVAKKVKKAKRVSGAGPTKLDTANKIYVELGGDKDKVIARIQEVCSMSFAGARTYFYNAKKGV